MSAIEPLPSGLLDALSQPDAYPEDPSAQAGVSQIQTHISHLYLSRDRVYKVRKAVRLEFLSFASRAERNADCVSEVALNRRLAPDVYLGLAPIVCGEDDRWRVGRAGEALSQPADSPAPEHCVVMRRLASDAAADVRLAEGRLETRHIDAIADRIARFHALSGLGAPAPFEPAAWIERIAAPIRTSLDLADSQSGSVDTQSTVDGLRALLRAFLDEHANLFEQRRVEGRIVDGHGDLQLAHIWFEGDSNEPLVIDCVEFDEALRQIDVAAELAFCAMDLIYRKRPDFAQQLLDRYARETDDYGLFGIIDFHIAHRSLIRAVVAQIAAAEPELAETQRELALGSAERHLALALRAARGTTAERGAVIVVCGAVGTGKSTVARAVAQQAGGVVIASDVVRKHLAGLHPEDRAAARPDGGIYTREMTQLTYAGMLERARAVLDSGRAAVLDATYSRASDREAAFSFAEELGTPLVLIEVLCDEGAVLERLEARVRSGRGPSDAGPEMHRPSVESFEAIASGRSARSERDTGGHLTVRTDTADWRPKLQRELAHAIERR